MAEEIYRERQWTKYLPDGFVVQVYLRTIRGQIVLFSAALIKNTECITRYDNAHGFAQRDIIGRKSAGTIAKERFDTLTLNEVFNYARSARLSTWDRRSATESPC